MPVVGLPFPIQEVFQTCFSQKVLKWLSRIVLALLIDPHILQVFQCL